MIRHYVAWEPQDIAPLLRQHGGPHVIHKRRQSGGSTELIKFAEERFNSMATIVCPNKDIAQSMKRLAERIVGAMYIGREERFKICPAPSDQTIWDCGFLWFQPYCFLLISTGRTVGMQ